MQRLLYLIPLLLMSSCAAVPSVAEGPSGVGLCLGLPPLADNLADALVAPVAVPDAVKIAGARLIAGIDAGCET